MSYHRPFEHGDLRSSIRAKCCLLGGALILIAILTTGFAGRTMLSHRETLTVFRPHQMPVDSTVNAVIYGSLPVHAGFGSAMANLDGIISMSALLGAMFFMPGYSAWVRCQQSSSYDKAQANGLIYRATTTSNPTSSVNLQTLSLPKCAGPVNTAKTPGSIFGLDLQNGACLVI